MSDDGKVEFEHLQTEADNNPRYTVRGDGLIGSWWALGALATFSAESALYLDDPKVHRRHAELIPLPGKIKLRALQAESLLIDGKAVRSEVVLRGGMIYEPVEGQKLQVISLRPPISPPEVTQRPGLQVNSDGKGLRVQTAAAEMYIKGKYADILDHLLKQPGYQMSVEALQEKVWPETKTPPFLDTYLSNLRTQLKSVVRTENPLKREKGIVSLHLGIPVVRH